MRDRMAEVKRTVPLRASMPRMSHRALRMPNAVPSPPAASAPNGTLPKPRNRMLAVARPSIDGGQYACRKLAAMMLPMAIPAASTAHPIT